MSVRTRPLMLWSLLLLYVAPLANVLGNVYISEFLASNDSGLQDGDGDSEDWIEIHNDDADAAADLTNHFLTDQSDNAKKWQFPDGTMIAPNEYFIVFASNKDRNGLGEFHTNFKLKAGGEYLALYDDTTILSQFTPTFPSQQADRSYGVDANGDEGFFGIPTPGSSNNLIDPPIVQASEPRGLKDTSFQVFLHPGIAGTSIRYTTDGSIPTPTNGMDYEIDVPLPVSTTTTLRARNFRPTGETSRTSTFTYIFVSDVLRQPREIANFPNNRERKSCGQCSSSNLKIVNLDMGMDPIVVEKYGARATSGMLSIPTISLVGDVEDDLFGPNGFYFNNRIEKEMSLEMLYEDAAGEQIDVGVESHAWDRLKRSIRLNFRSEYGNAEWKTSVFQNSCPLNGQSALDVFRNVILRSGNQNSWTRREGRSHATIIMDQFVRDTHMSVSDTPGSHGTFIHLYLNGVYWGMYNLVERPDQHFAHDYSDNYVDEDNWYFESSGVCKGDDCEAPRAKYLMDDLVHRDMSIPENYQEMQQYVDIDRFLDYMIVQLWAGVSDWPTKNYYINYYMGDDKNPPTPIRFIAWDSEYALNVARNGKITGAGNGARVPDEIRYSNLSGIEELPRIWHALFTSQQFRSSFVERVDVLLDGPLSGATAIARWNTLAAFVEGAMIGESARWGDSLGSGLLEPDVQWQEQLEVVRDLLGSNKEKFLDELSKAGLYGPELRATEKYCMFGFVPLLGAPFCAASHFLVDFLRDMFPL